MPYNVPELVLLREWGGSKAPQTDTICYAYNPINSSKSLINSSYSLLE